MEAALGADRESERRSPRTLGLVVVVILVAAAVRFGSLWTAPSPPPDLSKVRQVVSQWLSDTSPLPLEADGSIAASSLDPKLVELGVTRIEVQRFDPNALVMIRAGVDGQPGVAGVDDNGDALVDNRSELGATRSDDVCVVVAADDRPQPDEPVLVLQRGAFVPADDSEADDQGVRQRGVVIGQSGDDRWSFLVAL